MKIFAIEGYGHYCGGVVIAAAEDEEHAIELAKTVNDGTYRVDYSRPSNVKLLTSDYTGIEGVLHSYHMGE